MKLIAILRCQNTIIKALKSLVSDFCKPRVNSKYYACLFKRLTGRKRSSLMSSREKTLPAFGFKLFLILSFMPHLSSNRDMGGVYVAKSFLDFRADAQ